MTPTQLEVQGQAIFIAALIELVLGGMSALLIVNWWRAARGDLARNPYLGIRTESTLRNEQTWVAGNRAAIRTAPLYLLFNAALAAALFPAAWHGWRLVICLVGGAGFVVLIGLMIWSAVVGSRAARQVGGPKDPRAGLSPNLEPPAVTVKLSERQKTILGWVCAAIGCGLTLLLLGNIIDGYVLAGYRSCQVGCGHMC
jgi:SdpI/YfhL protein family